MSSEQKTECLQKDIERKHPKRQSYPKGPRNKSFSTEVQWWRDRIEGSIAKSRKVRGGNYVQLATIGYETNKSTSQGNDQGNVKQFAVPENRCLVFRGFCPDHVEKFVNGKKNNALVEKPGSKPMMLKMITDKRSVKAQHILKNCKTNDDMNPAELVWWFSQSSEQYRIAGKLFLIGGSAEDTSVISKSNDHLRHGDKLSSEMKNDIIKAYLEERKRQWGNLSDNAREQFYWNWPGKEYDGPPEDIPVGGRENLQDDLKALNIKEEDVKSDENRATKMGKVLEPPENFMLLLLQPNCCKYLRLSDNFAQRDELFFDTATVSAEDENDWRCYRTNP